jgi:hypothetical protein
VTRVSRTTRAASMGHPMVGHTLCWRGVHRRQLALWEGGEVCESPAARQWTTNRKETDITDVGLLYVGGVLFVNAVMLLGKAERRRRTTRGRMWVARPAHATSFYLTILSLFAPSSLRSSRKRSVVTLFARCGASGRTLSGTSDGLGRRGTSLNPTVRSRSPACTTPSSSSVHAPELGFSNDQEIYANSSKIHR